MQLNASFNEKKTVFSFSLKKFIFILENFGQGSLLRGTMEPNYKTIPVLAGYIDRVGAQQIHFKKFIVKEYRGDYYLEKCIIRIKDDGDIECSVDDYAPTPQEAGDIKKEVIKQNWPRTINARDSSTLSRSPDSVYYEFIDRRDSSITMVQERSLDKNFYAWTFFSDGVWRQMEPEIGLPFWKPAKKRCARIMIHEGAKAACYVERLLSEKVLHPWLEELMAYEHWGMIGGALAPGRSIWKEVRQENPTEVVYVCDNDFPGRSALNKVAKCYGGPMKGIMFDNDWPVGWDMADEMPAGLFSKTGRYIGKSLKEITQPATWATSMEENPENKKARKIAVMKSCFKEEWLHCIRPEVYIHKEWPHIIKTLDEFNHSVNGVSDVANTAGLLKKDMAGLTAMLSYDPGLKPGVYGSGHGRVVNTHMPSKIKSEKGDPKLWISFVEHLFPVEKDRLDALRWCATLVVRPEIKMHYGLLLISEMQGVGKSTLGFILAELIGKHNVSEPSEQTVVDSAFNDWAAHKRLAIVHEIYAGHSSKAYNKLKNIITDPTLNINRKYLATYDIENWLHIFACSNSKRAIQLSLDDRRWAVPKVREEKLTNEYWASFYEWLYHEGGLQIIKGWMEGFLKKNECVKRGEPAPWSSMKQEVIEEGLSPGLTLVANTLDMVKEEVNGHDVFMKANDFMTLIKDELYEGRHHDRLERPSTICKLAKSMGFYISENRAAVKEWGLRGADSKLICTCLKDALTPATVLAQEKREPFDFLKLRNKNKAL